MDRLQLPDICLDSKRIKVIMINEVTPQDPSDFFYSTAEQPDYMKTTLSLFRNAGADVNNIQDIINKGIYITTAVKCPKSSYSVDSDVIKNHNFILEEELKLYPNLRVIMLMGDVAKKAFNMIAKKNTKKNVIPSESTYKIRKNEYFYGDIRVFPSYIMTGGNILIEKSKVAMVTDDIKQMLEIIKN
jgi:uracil-DNA glycosylase